MNESENKKRNINGILIHQLPVIYVEEVLNLDCLRRGGIRYHFHDIVGLHIYFFDSDKVAEYANYRKIQVKEHFFQIYLKVTNLTIHEIVSYTNDPRVIKKLMKLNGFNDIIDLYPVYGFEEHDRHKSSIILPDYRVILNIPEVFYRYSLRPLPWPERPGFAFRISFYCRLCHENGHKTFECQTYFKIESSNTNYTADRNVTHESYSPDLRAQNSELQGNATNLVDHDISGSCSYSTVSDPGHFHACNLKNEPRLNMTGCIGRQSELGTINPHPGLQRKVSLSEGIKEAIAKSETARVLSPDSLINLLNFVRRRRKKKLMEITLIYTSDIFGLIHQLEFVKETYYRTNAQSSANEDRDLRYLDSLQERLREQMNLLSNQGETNISQERPCSSSFVGESSSSRSQLTATGLWSETSSDSD